MADTKQQPISRRDAVQAAAEGGDAFRAGKPLTDCPYQLGGDDDVRAEFLATYYRKGYAAAEKAE